MLHDQINEYTYLLQLLCCSEAQAINGGSTEIRPLPKLCRCLLKAHASYDGAVDESLGAIHRDNAVRPAVAVEVEGDRNGLRRRLDPVLLRHRVDLKHVRPRCKHWLLAAT